MVSVTAGFLVLGSKMIKISNITHIEFEGSTRIFLRDAKPIYEYGATRHEVTSALERHAAKVERDAADERREASANMMALAASIDRLTKAVLGDQEKAPETNQVRPTTLLADLGLKIITVKALHKVPLKTVADVYHYGNDRLKSVLTPRAFKEVNSVIEDRYQSLPD